MISIRNWVIINPQDSNPKRGISGIFAMVIGVLKGLLHSGFRYLNQMTEKFTTAKIVNVPKLVISATTPMLPTRTKKQGKIIAARMAIHGVLLPESFERLRGKKPSLAIPYIILEETSSNIKTVFAVANKAITDMVRNAL